MASGPVSPFRRERSSLVRLLLLRCCRSSSGCIVSYVPAVWHPQMLITNAGAVDYLRARHADGRTRAFNDAVADGSTAGKKNLREGVPANPIYLPAPHEVVARILHLLHHAARKSQTGNWLHESLWHSIQIIFWGFLISSLVGVPLGVLCGDLCGVVASERALHRVLPLSCRRRPSARSPSPSSASMTVRRSPSSSSALCFSRS